MTSDQTGTEKQAARDLTSPPGGKTHEATTPPGTGETDEAAVKIAEENLKRAGAGH